jgi:hypothetical protein
MLSFMATPEELAERLRAARDFALSLMGLNSEEAKEKAVTRGYLRSEVIPSDVEAVTVTWTRTGQNLRTREGRRGAGQLG